jgi:putative oxidoreductase
MSFIGNMLGAPETAVILSGIVMLIAGISLLIGFKTQLVSIVLIAVLIPITLTIQVGQISTLGPLFKNVAILGGLLFFSINSNVKIQKQ